ncbi:MAG: hypothetical protein AAFN10_14895 [Bacteroidota bacterium]
MSITILIFLGSTSYFLIIMDNGLLMGPIQTRDIFIELATGFCFFCIPALLLIISAPLNAFLRYRYRLAHGETMSLDEKLEQIGLDE